MTRYKHLSYARPQNTIIPATYSVSRSFLRLVLTERVPWPNGKASDWIRRLRVGVDFCFTFLKAVALLSVTNFDSNEPMLQTNTCIGLQSQ